MHTVGSHMPRFFSHKLRHLKGHQVLHRLDYSIIVAEPDHHERNARQEGLRPKLEKLIPLERPRVSLRLDHLARLQLHIVGWGLSIGVLKAAIGLA